MIHYRIKKREGRKNPSLYFSLDYLRAKIAV